MTVSNELGNMKATAAVAYYKVFYRRVACRSGGKQRRSSVIMAGLRAKIRSDHFGPNFVLPHGQ
jgi:hypothetical protein